MISLKIIAVGMMLVSSTLIAALPPATYEVSPPIKHVSSPQSLPPILLKIAECESGNKQFKDDGSVIRGVVNQFDVGRFQINTYYHGDEARNLGMDLMTYEGNTRFALWLYAREGTRPWSWSSACWNTKGL